MTERLNSYVAQICKTMPADPLALLQELVRRDLSPKITGMFIFHTFGQPTLFYPQCMEPNSLTFSSSLSNSSPIILP